MRLCPVICPLVGNSYILICSHTAGPVSMGNGVIRGTPECCVSVQLVRPGRLGSSIVPGLRREQTVWIL